MNFYTIRILLLVFICMFIYFLLKKQKIELKNRRMLYIMLIILFIAVFQIMPERSILKFKELNAAFKYSFPNKNIIFKTEIDNMGFVVYRDSNVNDVIYFENKNNKWLFASPKSMYMYKHSGSYIVTIKKVKNSDDYFIYVDSGRKENSSIEIIDSFGNVYNEVRVGSKYNYYYFIKDKPKDYFIVIDGKSVYIDKI